VKGHVLEERCQLLWFRLNATERANGFATASCGPACGAAM
jgi:hypothetical protein